MTEEDFYFGEYAASLIQFLHAHYNTLADNLRRYVCYFFLLLFLIC